MTKITGAVLATIGVIIHTNAVVSHWDNVALIAASLIGTGFGLIALDEN